MNFMKKQRVLRLYDTTSRRKKYFYCGNLECQSIQRVFQEDR